MARPKHTTAGKKHPRKRKKAKAHGKNDPGVPQLLGFKEYAKKEAELKQKRVAELRARQEEARLKETSQRRSLESLQQDALRKQRDFEQKEAGLQQLQGHPRLEKEGSRRAYYREFRKVIQAADVVLEVLDARDPQGCRCPQVEEAVLQAGGNKKLVLVLNKIDLVSKEVVAGWLKYLRNELPTVAFKASTQQQSRHLKQSKVQMARASSRALAQQRAASPCPVSHSDPCSLTGVSGCSPPQIMQHYGVPAYRDVTEFLAHLARRKGKLRKGGVPDHEKVAKAVLSDWMRWRSRFLVVPPRPNKAQPCYVAFGGQYHFLPRRVGGIRPSTYSAFSVSAPRPDLPSVPVGIGLAPAGLTSGAGAEMEEEETAGEEETAMDEDRDLELDTVTVELKAKNKAAAAVKKPVPRAPSLEEISALDPLHQGQGLRAASRRRKKQQKRAEKIASKLSATLTAAMNFGTAGH
nr:guanine nucleotide-binding protein-like 3-like protein [Chelonoidis abingdonii]